MHNSETRAGCGCFWGLCGSSTGKFWANSRKIAGKFSRIVKCFEFQDFGHREKENLLQTLGPYCPEPCAQPSVRGVFRNRQLQPSQVFLSNLPDLRTLRPLTNFSKCREPQICQKFVPKIVFQGSNQGDPNLSKICRKFEKRQFPDKFSNFRQMFDKFGLPCLEP